MKYYQFRNTVVECDDDTNWKDIVLAVRHVHNANTFHPVTIMIEDIEEITEEEFKSFIKTN